MTGSVSHSSVARFTCSGCAAAFIAVSLTPSVAAASDVDSAPDPDERALSRGHLQLALRTGVAIPSGSERGGIPLSDLFYVVVPITVEAGYRKGPLYLGGAFSAGPGVVASADVTCNEFGMSCAREDYQLTIGARVYAGRPNVVAGWVGVALGWEISDTQISDSTGRASGIMDGPIAALDAGIDAPLGRRFTLGPYIGVALGRYIHRTQSPEPLEFSNSIDGAANHTWIGLGARGTFAMW